MQEIKLGCHWAHRQLANIIGTIVVHCNNEVTIMITTLQVECPGVKVLHCIVSNRQHQTTITGVPDTTFCWLLKQV